MDPREMFNEIYGIAPDDGHGDGDDGEGYTMAFGTEMLEEEAEESTPAPTQRKGKRKRGAISSESSGSDEEDSNASNASLSRTSGEPRRRRKSYYCIEEDCEKYAQGGMKGRCMRHDRQRGDTYNTPRCKEEG